jgi:DNA polymerase-3 subunit delta'
MLFSQIIGQKEVKKALISTIERQRVSHAQLFLGPEGSGKLALALAYAQYINCTNKQNGESCGQCSNCHKYQKLAHPDLHFIFPTAAVGSVKSPVSDDFMKEWRELILETDAYINLPAWYKKIGIEKKQAIINTRDCNEIVKKLSYESYESEYKVMIIWMVEKLHYAAAPKILKILEEPPPKTLFILISENHHLIINTILSRTQLLKIPPIEEDDLRNYLLNKHQDASAIRNMLPLANGNMIRAEELLNDSEELEYTFQHFVQWMRTSYSYKIEDILDFANTMAKNSRERNIAFLIYVLRMVHESLMMNYQMIDQLKLTPDEKNFMLKFSQFLNPSNIPAITDEINRAISHIGRNAQSNILFTDLSLKVGRMLRGK